MPENTTEKRPTSSVLYTKEASVVDKVPLTLRVAAAWSWRAIVVGIIVVAGVWTFTSLTALFVPLVIALIIAAPLERLVTWMERIKFPRALGSLIAILVLILVAAGLGTLASTAFMSEYEDLRDAAVEGFDTFIDWLVTGPIGVDQSQVDELVGTIQTFFEDNAQGLASGALSVGSAIGTIFAGIVIALVALFFFMRDGRQIWHWTAGLVPDEAVERVEKAGLHSWITLRRYTQTTVFVAFADAVGIGLAAWILGVPLALPIAILVFLFSFIPLIGATLSGIIASLVALVDGGWTTALLMLGAVLIVQQIEGNVLYPWLFGKAASIHPLAVLLTISAGTLTLGIIGAVIAVPVVATLYAFNRGLRRGPDEDDDDDRPPITSQIPVLAERSKEAIQRARGAMTHTGEVRVRRQAASDPAARGRTAGGSEPEPQSEQIPTRGPDTPDK
ncbi:AI-2E family transporter [Demequina sp. SO4-18]|uniref:AI-2E family transporter n=1 Tax=Demequina sp. SO4-18 TaxID=3401026 RepID=UPI003B5C31C7